MTGEKENYKLHYTVADFSIHSNDLLFNNTDSFGAVDYLVLYEQGVTRTYLSKQGVAESKEIGKSLLDDSFIERFFVDANSLIEEMKEFPQREVEEPILLEQWSYSITLNQKLWKMYRYLGQFFQKSLEERVLSKIDRETLVAFLNTGLFAIDVESHVQKYAKRLQELGEIKLDLHTASEKLFTFVDKKLPEFVTVKYGLPNSLGRALTVAELKSALFDGFIVSEEELRKREKGAVMLKESGEWKLYTGKKFDEKKSAILDGIDSEIKGDIAYKGVVKGRVVTHLSWTDTTEIKEGDVLVTGMTNPQMIPLLKKAAAVVTDEGGIACHAAIVSRELKIPCIVGTKVATQVLKDGMEVEVDADNGTIKIVE